jgi:GNAT superfamily N-acetyltransferase
VPIRIRRVDIADAAVCAGIDSLVAECFKPSDFIGDRLPKTRTGYWWVAFDRKVPVAFACLRPSIRWEQTGYLALVGVVPAARGNGFQRRLILKRVAHARSLGWHTVLSDTSNDNVPSMRSLIACGFRPYIPRVKWSVEGAVYWKRATEPRLSA